MHSGISGYVLVKILLYTEYLWGVFKEKRNSEGNNTYGGHSGNIIDMAELTVFM